MSGSTIGGVVGGVIGYYVSGGTQQGAQTGWMIGSAVGGYVDPDVIKGPRLTDPQQQTANEGAPIPLLYGTCATVGTIIQCQSKPTEHKNKQHTGKGGPVQQTYTYTRTVAIAICRAAPLGGEIKLRRAWVNGKLAYDATGTGKLDAESVKFLGAVTFYSGSETQTPDPDLEALPAEDGGGVGNVPAYRGLCYAVLPDCDVTQGGGAIPVIKWEVVSEGTQTQNCYGIYDDALFYYPLSDASQDGIASELMAGLPGHYSNTPGVQGGPKLRAGALGSFRMTTRNDYMWANYTAATGPALSMVGRPAWTVAAYFSLEDAANSGTVLANIAAFWYSQLTGGHDWYLFVNSAEQPGGGYTEGNGTPVDLHQTPPQLSGMVMLSYQDHLDGTATLKLYVNGGEEASRTIDTASDKPGVAGQEGLVVGGGPMYPNSYGFIGCVSDVAGWARYFDPVEARDAYDNANDYLGVPDLQGGLVDPLTGKLISGCVNTVTAGEIDLADVVADLIKRATITDYDVSALVGIPVRGYPILQPTSAGAALLELQKVHFFDLPEWGNSGETYVKLRAVRRGGAAVFTLTDDDLVDVDDNEDTRAQQVERARVVNVIATDPDSNYDPIKQTSERASENIKADSEITITTAVVFNRDETAQRADIFQKVQWEEAAGKITRTVPEEFTQFVTSDTGIVDGRRYRIDAIDAQDGFSKWSLTRDRVRAYESSATGSPGVTTPDPVQTIIGPTLFQALNLPSLSSKDNVPGMYIFACGMFPAWEGCDLYLSVDGGASEQLVASIINPATMGKLTDDMATGDVTLSLQLYNDDELDSATDDQLALRLNAAAVTSSGTSEILQYKTATDTGVKTYDLTTLSRGQLDTTEVAHVAGDAVAMLDGSQYFLKIDGALAGQTLIFRPVSRGTVATNNDTYSVVFNPIATSAVIVDGNDPPPATTTSPDPTSGGAGNPGTPTARTTGTSVVTPSLTAGLGGASANSTAINAAFAGLTAGVGGIVRIPAGDWYINPANPIKPTSNSVLDLETNSATLRATNGGLSQGTSFTAHKDLVQLVGSVHDVVIHGGHLIGFRDAWAAAGGTSFYTPGTSEWNHAIYVGDSSYNVTIYNVTCSDCTGDGISIGRTAHDVHVLNVKSTNNRRQGISAAGISASANIKLENCECSYIGLNDGTSPMAGIDCEVDSPSTNSTSGIQIVNCYVHHNVGPGVICYKSVNNITISDLRSEYNSKGIYAVDSDNVTISGATKLRYNKYEGMHLAGTCTTWSVKADFFGNKTKQYGTPIGSTTTTTPTATQKAKQVTVASTVTGLTYDPTSTWGPI